LPHFAVDQIKDLFYLCCADLIKATVKKLILNSAPAGAIAIQDKTSQLAELATAIEKNERAQMVIIAELENQGLEPDYYQITIPILL
jgi:hypothetical protein